MNDQNYYAAPAYGVMPAWGDREIGRFTFRTSLFARRGLPRAAAEQLADRLAVRDFERDDRRICLECAHIQRTGRCFKQQGGQKGQLPRWEPVRDLFQRCANFDFQTP